MSMNHCGEKGYVCSCNKGREGWNRRKSKELTVDFGDKHGAEMSEKMFLGLLKFLRDMRRDDGRKEERDGGKVIVSKAKSPNIFVTSFL